MFEKADRDGDGKLSKKNGSESSTVQHDRHQCENGKHNAVT